VRRVQRPATGGAVGVMEFKTKRRSCHKQLAPGH
jgi:hypothetical protein